MFQANSGRNWEKRSLKLWRVTHHATLTTAAAISGVCAFFFMYYKPDISQAGGHSQSSDHPARNQYYSTNTYCYISTLQVKVLKHGENNIDFEHFFMICAPVSYNMTCNLLKEASLRRLWLPQFKEVLAPTTRSLDIGCTESRTACFLPGKNEKTLWLSWKKDLM